MSLLIEALRRKYEGDIACAKANIHVYIHNPVGIGEHPDIVAALDEEVKKLSTARDNLSALIEHYGEKVKASTL
jgi:hypothetical protein